MTFNTALSGLNAASADLRVTGNNIANAGTTGFKESRSEFSDVFATAYSGISATAIGAGVKLARVAQQFTQGNIDATGNNLDLALSGKGFFVLSDGGARNYTRDGSFQIDRDGYVVNADGKRLQAYPVKDRLTDTFDTGSLEDLRLVTTEAPPRATSGVEAVLNLSSAADDLSAVPFDAADPSSYNYSTSLTVYDSLGQSHVSTLYFRNTGPLSWAADLSVDGALVGTEQALTFAGDGSLASPAGPVNFGTFAPTNGADPLDIGFDFSRATEYGTDNAVSSLTQDGYASGRMTGVDIDQEGKVFARFTNGQSLALGQVAIASFANPQGLQQAGDNAWVDTFDAGDPILGVAGSGDFGTVRSGGLEASNVDIAAQLVNLITAQRNFQANAQVISTADAVTQTIINIR
ncbi:MAG TPA: flagellar hook protein FlgE [Gammaproteobacteria bacterium]|nr:flagellar hook protein FlgE [Gammaproteobacteria bacterium]